MVSGVCFGLGVVFSKSDRLARVNIVCNRPVSVVPALMASIISLSIASAASIQGREA